LAVPRVRGIEQKGRIFETQTEGFSEQVGCFEAGRHALPTLDVADRPHAYTRCLGQRFLTQPGSQPELPEERAESNRSVSGHGLMLAVEGVNYIIVLPSYQQNHERQSVANAWAVFMEE